MKRVRINKQSIALVYKNGDFRRVLLPGNHWIGYSTKVYTYDQLNIYQTLEDMELVIKNSRFSDSIVQLNLKSNEIALVYMRGNLYQVLSAGNYFYVKGELEYTVEQVDLNSTKQITSIDKSVLQNSRLASYVKSLRVENYEQGLLFFNGRFSEKLGPGNYYYWIGSKTIDLLKADIRSSQMELSGQELLTKDKAAIRINFQLEYKVADAKTALLENANYSKQLYTNGQLAMRDIIGSMTLDELLESKDKVGDYILKKVAKLSSKIGLEVSHAGIKDIILPGEVKDIMNQVLIAEKRAQANAIARRDETASTRTMLNTAKLMEDNTVLLKLKELEYVEKIASKIGEIKLSNGGAIVDQLSQVLAK